MTKTIKVTQADIDKGRPDNCFNCPVALAIKRAGFWEYVYVGHGIIEFIQRKITYVVWMPRKVEKFIKHFDKFKNGQPFSFKLIYGEKH